MKKKWFIPIIVILLILIGIMVWLCLRTEESFHYTLTEEKDGSIQLTIYGSFAENSWAAENSRSDVVDVVSKISRKNRAVFSVKPQSIGYAEVEFYTELPSETETGGLITITFLVDMEGNLSVYKESMESLEPIQQSDTPFEASGKIGNSSYTVTSDGTLLQISVLDPDSNLWSSIQETGGIVNISETAFLSENDQDADAGDVTENGNIFFDVTALEAGKETIDLTYEGLSEALSIQVSVSATGSISVESITIIPFETDVGDGEDSTLEEVQALVGSLPLLDHFNAREMSVNTRMSADCGIYRTVALLLDVCGVEWYCEIAPELSMEAFYADTSLDDLPPRKEYHVEGATAAVIAYEGYTAVWWEADGMAYRMNSQMETTAEITIEAVSEILTQTKP